MKFKKNIFVNDAKTEQHQASKPDTSERLVIIKGPVSKLEVIYAMGNYIAYMALVFFNHITTFM